MIEMFDGSSSEVKNMIDIQFQQASNQDKTSNILYRPTIKLLVLGNTMTMQRLLKHIATTPTVLKYS